MLGAKRIACGVGLLTVAFTTLWFLTGNDGPRGTANPIHLSASETPHDDTGSEVAPTVPPRIPSEPLTSLGDSLQEYWGVQWPEMKQKYAQHGTKFDAPSTALTPWQQVAEETQKIARGYYERDLAFLRSSFLQQIERDEESFFRHFPVAPTVDKHALLVELGSTLSDIDAELELIGDRYVIGLDVALNRALGEVPERFPLADFRPAEKQPGDFYRIDVECGGWFVTYHLKLDDFPDLADLMKQRNSLGAKRNARIKTFMSTRSSGG